MIAEGETPFVLHGLTLRRVMPSLGSYLLGAAQLVVLAVGFGLAAFLLRARLLPGWRGAPGAPGRDRPPRSAC